MGFYKTHLGCLINTTSMVQAKQNGIATLAKEMG